MIAYGVFVGLGVPRLIIGTSPLGFVALIFDGLAIIRLISSGDGIPGVGVVPGLTGFFSCS